MGFTHTEVGRGEEGNSDYYWSCSFELSVACSRSPGSSVVSSDDAAVEAGECGLKKESKRHLDSSFSTRYKSLY